MAVIGRAVLELLGDSTQFRAEMEGAGKHLERVGQRMTSVGRSLSLRLTAPLAAVGAVGVRSFADFDAAMTQSLAIMGDVSDAMRGEMAEAAKEVGRTTLQSASQAADSFFFLASAGLDATQSVAALPQVAAFAQAGMFDMARATDLATDAQSALGLASEDAQANLTGLSRVTDVLVAANTLANASVEQFAEALTARAGSALKIVNKDVEEGVAVLAAFADQGVKGAEAGTRLDIVLRDLQRAALGNQKEFAKLGVTVFDANGNLAPMADIIGDLEVALAGMSDQQRRATFELLGFQDRSLSALLQLIGTSDAIREYERALRDAGGATQDVADRQLESFSAQMKLAKDRALIAAQTIGEQLAPKLLRLADAVARAAEAFDDMSPALRSVLINVGLLAAALGPLLIIVGQLTIAFQALGLHVVIASFSRWAVATIALVPHVRSLAGALALLQASLGPVAIAVLAVGAAVTAGILVWRKWGDEIALVVRAVGNVVRDRLTGIATFVRDTFRLIVFLLRDFRDNALVPIRDFVLRAGELLLVRLGGVVAKVGDVFGDVARLLNPGLAIAVGRMRSFADDVGAEMARLRQSVQEGLGGGVVDAPAQFSELRTALTAATERMEHFARKAKEAGDEALRASFTKQAMEARNEVIALRSELDKLGQPVMLEGLTVTVSGDTGAGAIATMSAEIKEVRDELESSLRSIAALGSLLGDAFDPAAESADAYRRAVEDLVDLGVSFDAVVGPQGETLRQLANTYLDLESGVESAAQQVREAMDAIREAEAVTRSVMTPTEQWVDAVVDLDAKLAAGLITLETYERAMRASGVALDEATGRMRARQAVEAEGLQLTERLRTAEEARNVAIQRANELLAQKVITEEVHARAVQAANEAYAQTVSAGQTAADSIASAFDRMGSRAADAVADFATGAKASIKDFVTAAMRDLARLLARILFIRALTSAIPGAGALTTAAGITARAHGGPVRRNHPYLVGEHGPELFVPASAGTVVAGAGMQGGGVTVDFSNFPPARNSIAAARDDEWQTHFQESLEATYERGWRPPGR